MMSATTQLQFAPFSSALDAGFWHKLSQLKLDVFGLDDKLVSLCGYYCNSDADLLPPRVTLDYTAFDVPFATPSRCFTVNGQLKNTNTLDQFKTCDKKALLDAQGTEIWDSITSGRAIDDPSQLTRFILLTHADLKKYRYYYWFAFTAVCVPEKISLLSDPVGISSRFSVTQIAGLVTSFDKLHAPAFIVKELTSGQLEVHQLSKLMLAKQDASCSKILLGFCDPCTLKTHPGWPLRNLLALAAVQWRSVLSDGFEVLCLRDRTKDGHRSIQHSIILNVSFGQQEDVTADQTPTPKYVGWEKNEKQKLLPRMVDLSSSMDPRRLAESAVDLNLKLMRWRLLPDLDLDRISQTRCLLLGAGTLGCNVARCLLGWGVRNITLVDNGCVSFSNPVRQSLFTFGDSLNGGRPKAQAAAESLRLIFPGVNAVGVELSIPMPGHTVSDTLVEAVRQDVEKLRQLFDEHDAVFLLMDTRESRWLPTVMATATRKIVLNTALGFDTYLVVRHGVREEENTVHPVTTAAAAAAAAAVDAGDWTRSIPGHRLGCYFCNDVVAPGNSTRDRTLDQQCTVSRPGLSMLAAALTVELFVSLLVHPLGGQAPADTSSHDDHLLTHATSPLGIVPHQIRGFISRFHNMLPATAAFDRCTACCPTVIEAYKSGGFEFLLNAFNRPSFLEDLTGLSQLQAETLDSEMWDISDFESVEDDVM